MITKIIIFVSLNLFLYLNYRFIIDFSFEDTLKDALKILELSGDKIKKERRIILHLVTLSIITPMKLSILLIIVCGYLYLKPMIVCTGKIKEKKEQLHYEFPIWIRSIQCHLQSSNVVVSIEKSYDYAPQLLKNHLKDLIWKLSCDPHRLDYYTDFMSQYENLEIEKMMKILYRFNHMDRLRGEKHLDRMIESTSIWMASSREKKQELSLDRYSIFGVLPFLIVSLYFVIMMGLVMFSMIEGGWMI